MGQGQEQRILGHESRAQLDCDRQGAVPAPFPGAGARYLAANSAIKRGRGLLRVRCDGRLGQHRPPASNSWAAKFEASRDPEDDRKPIGNSFQLWLNLSGGSRRKRRREKSRD
ncbi:hypothetical protein FSOLCH5_004733 [Fusarium solani]